MVFLYDIQCSARGGIIETTADPSDIRGLGTARLGFVAELPLSFYGSSNKSSYPKGGPRILLTVIAPLMLNWMFMLFAILLLIF
jgi:hypothetical protein